MERVSSTVRESDIEEYLVRRVAALGGEVRKVKWIGRRGAPDRLVMLPGINSRGPAGNIPSRRILIELKSPTGKLSSLQRVEISMLKRYGWEVHVVSSFEEVDGVLR